MARNRPAKAEAYSSTNYKGKKKEFGREKLCIKRNLRALSTNSKLWSLLGF